MLPKVQKIPTTGIHFVGRPVATNCSSPLERVSEDFYLLPLVKFQPTYLKDTRDTIRKVGNIQLPPDIILASFVISVYTSVLQLMQDQAILKTLENLLCNKQQHLAIDTFVEKKDFFMEKLSTSKYNDAEPSRQIPQSILGVPVLHPRKSQNPWRYS